MFSIPLHSNVPMLQPDEFNREIQRRREKLTQVKLKSEKNKKNGKKGCNYVDTCYSKTQLYSSENISLQHALMIFQWLIRVEPGSNKKLGGLVSWLNTVNEGPPWPARQRQLLRDRKDNECFHILPRKLTKRPLYQLRACFSLEWPLSNLTFQLFFSFYS